MKKLNFGEIIIVVLLVAVLVMTSYYYLIRPVTLEKPKEVYSELKQFIPKKKIISFIKINSKNYLTKIFNIFKKFR